MIQVFEKFIVHSQRTLFLLGVLVVAIIGAVDYLTGYQLAFSIFYILPIYVITWYTNRRLGFAIAIISAVAWLLADFLAGQVYNHPLIALWNCVVRLGVFAIISH